MIATKSKAWIGVAIYLTLSALGAGIWVYRTRQDIEAERGVVKGLQQEVAGLRDVVGERDELEVQLAQLKECVGRYVTILPVPQIATEEKLLALVQRRCDESGVRLHDIKETRRPKKRSKRERKGAFTEIPIKLDLRGTHHEFLVFVNLLERDRSLIRVNSFTLTTPGNGLVVDGTKPLRIQLEISTFRYEA